MLEAEGLVTRSASRSPSAGSTPRRCAAGRTRRRSSPSPPTAPGSRSAASPASPSARPPPRRRSPQRRHRRRRRAVRRGRRPVRRRLRQRLVPPPRPARPRPQSADQCRLASSNSRSTASRREFLAQPGHHPAERPARHARPDRRQARLRRRARAAPAPACSTATPSCPAWSRSRRSTARRVKTLEGVDAAGRHARAAPAGVPGRLRHPVRLLHAGDDHGRRGAAGGEPEPHPRGRRARDLRQRLPLHGLREHHPRDPRRRGRRHEHQRTSTSSASPSSAWTRWATSPAARSSSRTSTPPGCCI